LTNSYPTLKGGIFLSQICVKSDFNKGMLAFAWANPRLADLNPKALSSREELVPALVSNFDLFEERFYARIVDAMEQTSNQYGFELPVDPTRR